MHERPYVTVQGSAVLRLEIDKKGNVSRVDAIKGVGASIGEFHPTLETEKREQSFISKRIENTGKLEDWMIFMPTLDNKGYGCINIGGGDTAQPINLGLRIHLIQERVYLKGKKVIDCGCGSGSYVLALRELGADAYGIEYSEQKVRKFKELGIEAERIQTGNIEEIDAADETFDVALLNEVLEHVPNDRKTLSEVYRILKPGGMLVIFSPNRWYPFETHGVAFRRGDVRLPPYATLCVPYIPLWLGNRILQYGARNYFPTELRRMVVQAGFQVAHRTYVWQTFENISGKQPFLINAVRPMLRAVCSVLQKIPLVRALGVSQVVFAVKRRSG